MPGSPIDLKLFASGFSGSGIKIDESSIDIGGAKAFGNYAAVNIYAFSAGTFTINVVETTESVKSVALIYSWMTKCNDWSLWPEEKFGSVTVTTKKSNETPIDIFSFYGVKPTQIGDAKLSYEKPSVAVREITFSYGNVYYQVVV